MRIGQLARSAGVSTKTLRHYESLGLLAPEGRSDAGYRLYGHEHLARLRLIVELRRGGLRLSEIGRIIQSREAGLDPCRDVGALLERRIGELRATLEALERYRDHLREAEGREENCPICAPINPKRRRKR